VDKSRQRQTIDSDASGQDEFVRHRTSQSQHGRQQFNVRSWRHPGEQAAGLQSPQCFHVAETSLSRMWFGCFALLRIVSRGLSRPNRNSYVAWLYEIALSC